MSEERDSEIAANLDRALESLAAAETLADSGYFDFAAARAYYAAFYRRPRHSWPAVFGSHAIVG